MIYDFKTLIADFQSRYGDAEYLAPSMIEYVYKCPLYLDSADSWTFVRLQDWNFDYSIRPRSHVLFIALPIETMTARQKQICRIIANGAVPNSLFQNEMLYNFFVKTQHEFYDVK